VPALLCLAVLFVALVRAGVPQRRDGGSWGRLLTVAARKALLATLPVLVAGLRGADLMDQLAIAFTPALLALGSMRALRRPGEAQALPLVTDAGLLDRVARLSARLGVALPQVRLLGTLGAMQAMAWAGGLVTPTLLLADGILARLTPDEQDGIVGHELAHLANGSLWMISVLGSVSGIAVALAGAHELFLPMLGPMAVFWTLRPFVSRRVELACDLRAARAVGFPQMASALDKIHAVHTISNEGLLARLFYATATHPPRAVRYERLRVQSEGALPELPAEAQRARQDQLWSRVQGAIWIALLAGGLRLAPAAPLLALFILLVPLGWGAALGSVLRRRARKQQPEFLRVRAPGSRLLLLGAALLIPAMFLGTAMTALPRSVRQASVWLIPCLLLGGLLLLLVGAFLRARFQKVFVAVTAAMSRHDYLRAIALAEAKPRLLRKSAALRYNVATALLLAGQRAAALAEAEALAEGGFAPAQFLLASLLRDGDPARAVQLCEQALSAHVDDASAHLALAKSLHAAGRPAEEAAARADGLAKGLRRAEVLAFRAVLRGDLRDYAGARALLKEALAISPGDAWTLCCAADVELCAGSADAPGAVQAAREAVRLNPFSMLGKDVDVLEQRLAQSQP
jgi:Zn-dependent protease with chaperone function/tetratricopeptide (TPR) repeat protein